MNAQIFQTYQYIILNLFCVKMATRAQTNLWLLDKTPIEEITGARLPSKEQVLLRYYYLHRDMKKTISASAKDVIQEVMGFWERAQIPTTTFAHAQTKLKKLVESYDKLKKTKNMLSDRHRMQEDIFKRDLEDIFDIAHSTALECPDVLDVDKEFLRRQREDRSETSMSGVDMVLAKKQERSIQRQDRQMRFRQRASVDANKLTEKAQMPSESSSESSSPSTTSSPDRYSQSLPKRTEQSPSRYSTSTTPVRAAVRDVNLISTWDREKLSVRQAAASFSATAQSLGVDINTISVSKSTVHRARISGRKECVMQIRRLNDMERLERVVLHWDGKLLPDISGSGEHADRIAVVVTAEDGVEFLLGVPATTDSTGKNVAALVMKEAEAAGVIDKIIGFGFDTTASNTGMVQGACTRMEQTLGRSVLWLACRHHIHEVILKDVFLECLGCSSGPDIAIFKRLQTRWQFVDTTVKRCETAETCDDLIEFFATNSTARHLKDEMLTFLREALTTKKHPREDYEELLRLCYAFLGGEDPKPLRRPGALHQARWMAKAIYCLKLQMLKSQLKLTTRETLGVRRMALFVSLIYVRQWHEAIVSVKAPLNDVRFLEILLTYPDGSLAKVADRALRRHLWYVNEENVALGFFDERVPEQEKRLMVGALQKPATGKECKRPEGKATSISLSLASFVTKKTRDTFHKLGVDESFLEKDPSAWKDDLRYIEGRRRALDLKVVNDCAERGIALVQRYLTSTKSKEQEQYLLQLVHHDLKIKGRNTKADLAKKTF